MKMSNISNKQRLFLFGKTTDGHLDEQIRLTHTHMLNIQIHNGLFGAVEKATIAVTAFVCSLDTSDERDIKFTMPCPPHLLD